MTMQSNGSDDIELAVEIEVELGTDADADADSTLQDVLNLRRERLEEKTERRTEAYTRLADKHAKASDQTYNASRQISSFIPMGQPILVGHHSERRHRRDIQRIDDNMRKSVEHSKTAAYYQDKLATMESNTAISSDDPDALEKLKQKLAGMQECQEYMKKVNAFIKKAMKSPEDERIAKLAELAEVDVEQATQWLTPRFGRIGYAAFSLSNNNANMKRVKERIALIEKQYAAILEQGEETTVHHDDIALTIVTNRAINRLQLIFDGKPDEEVRKKLKYEGFRWSPSEGAWQRQISNTAEYKAQLIVKHLQQS